MKSLFLTIILVSSLFSLDFLNDYNEALKEAKKVNKPIYLLITSTSCRWCVKFEKTTLKSHQVKNRLAKEFVTLHLVREINVIPDKFKTTPVPRHYFLNKKGDIIFNGLGYRNEEIFNSFMDSVQKRNMKNQ